MQLLAYYLFRIIGFFISRLSYKKLHQLGNMGGICAYYLHRPFRKKALTNLAIAFGQTKTEMERVKIAKKSFQNLMITCLEFFRFQKSYKNLKEIATLSPNPLLEQLLETKRGTIFLSAHQANWEIPFLALTEKYQGIAIGRPIKNHRLYNWILSIREMHGGKIVTPKHAIRASLKALSQGLFLGIVGDQAYPESPYSYPLFGTRAWTASTPALLAYKTGCPLVVGCTKRLHGHYYIDGSIPIWPNQEASVKEEVPRMMNEAMHFLEKSISEIPEQWMWVHDRWKQQGIDHVKRKYRYGFILVLLPPDPSPYMELLPLLRKIYPRSFLTFFVPKGTKIVQGDYEIKEYTSKKDLFIRDWRFQLVFDFYNSYTVRHHFRTLGAFKILKTRDIKKHTSLKKSLLHLLVKSECLTTDFL